MFLSRLTLDVRDRRARRALARPYELHRVVLLGFPADQPSGGCRVLFRLEPEERGSSAFVLVQSEREPDWEARRADGLELLQGHETKSVELAFAAGARCRFRLRANPTKKSHETRRRVGLASEEDQLAWLGRKGEEGGFRLEPSRTLVIPEGQTRFGRSQRRAQDDGPEIVCQSVRFEGVLTVTDPSQLVATVAAGIGSGKAFGFGLLSLAPAGPA